MSEELKRQIREYEVPKNSVAIWWFGQNGFIFKSAEGTLFSVDLYLTNSCASLPFEIDLSRKVPILLEPAEVEVDVETHFLPLHLGRRGLLVVLHRQPIADQGDVADGDFEVMGV